jgi:hypothetical protein
MAKNAIFYLKVLKKYTPETFSEEYIRHCGVIPVQSFGSHIHPQLPGLGLRNYYIDNQSQDSHNRTATIGSHDRAAAKGKPSKDNHKGMV